MNDNAGATTEYGQWDATVDGNTASARHAAIQALGEFADRHDTEALGDAYAAAIDAALPPSVSMNGGHFYGPYQPEAGEFEGYPVTEDGRLDIKAIVDGVDFWRIAEQFEQG